MNTTFTFKQALVFIFVTWCGILFQHNVYQVFLAVASGMLAYAIALTFVRTRAFRFVWFAILTICGAQLSVLIKKAIMEEGFNKTLKENPLGALVGDFVYGAKHLVISIIDFVKACIEAFGHENYALFNTPNYRLLVAFFVILILSLYLLRHKSIVEEPAAPAEAEA